ncbi:hypothetical protein WN944_025895 [Citrus x changshan-huyou]|uniref:Uncharacterized protein n=1 Tax=Citrus x changshan-huyou TaxID=2935761 RepID=A0AAP0QDE8_9ROSI
MGALKLTAVGVASSGISIIRRNVFRSGIAQDVSMPAKNLDRNELQSIGRERGTVNESGVVFFPRCGPVKYALMSPRRMPTYHHVSGEQPFFSNEQAKIGNGLVV